MSITKNAFPKQNFQETLASMVSEGGDERGFITQSGYNKYFVNPTDYSTVFNRGSCTSSPFSKTGFLAAKRLYESLADANYELVRHKQLERIKQLINYTDHDRFHVFFAPSGSDLCFYQLLFAKLLEPDRDIYNVVTCPEELGSGSIKALKGMYYSDYNQFGQRLKKDMPLSDSLRVECKFLPARSISGMVNNHSQEIVDIIHSRINTHSVNANLVIGSKSGIENNISVIAQAPEQVLWTVDLCQFRASSTLINGLIGMNCTVMLTGSKFYNAPPFCAALLVPKTLASKFHEASAELLSPFTSIFCQADIPMKFDDIRSNLPEFNNYGLLIRWEAALAEMEAFSKLNQYDVNVCIAKWNAFITKKLVNKGLFEIMPGHEVTNKTIVSFRVKSHCGRYLSFDELSQLHKIICTTKTDTLHGFDRVLVGQPVRYGDRSFLRLAIGSSDLREMVATDFDSKNDCILIDWIADCVAMVS